MKEVTYEDWQKNPIPRMMWVWDGINGKDKVQLKVVYVLRSSYAGVITIDDDDYYYESYNHCAEIGKQRRMTHRELSRWLREKPTREYKYVNSDNYIYSFYEYKEYCADEEVDDNTILIREDDSGWKEPLIAEDL